jgi:hypothetical protein
MKMKKILIYSLALGLILPMFNGCKKGADDPGLSLRSRDARITGIWELVEATESRKSVYTSTANTITTTITTERDANFDGSVFSFTELETTKIDTTTYKITKRNDNYKLEVEILKDNTSTTKETRTESEGCTENKKDCPIVKYANQTTVKNETKGNWFWLNSKKNKVAIDGPHQYFTGNIKRLSKDEIIFEEDSTTEYEEKTTTGTTTTKVTVTNTYTFKKI